MKYTEFYEYLPEYAKNIRQKVFVEEQKFENEFDEIDNTSLHILIFVNNYAAGTARMFTQDGGESYHIGRVAVLPEYRKLHLGHEMVNAMIEAAKELGAKRCELSAQVRVEDFYKKLGFVEQGEEYLDEYCPHIYMVKEL